MKSLSIRQPTGPSIGRDSPKHIAISQIVTYIEMYFQCNAHCGFFNDAFIFLPWIQVLDCTAGQATWTVD